MISNKAIQDYKKVLNNITIQFQNEIDLLTIDFEKPVQRFYIFIADVKYNVVIVKYNAQYKYEFRLYTNQEEPEFKYSAIFKFDEITGNSKITETIQMLEI